MDAAYGPDIDEMTSVDQKALATLQQCFNQVQGLLDRNRVLIKEINQNHESYSQENIRRNETLITELNGNIRTVLALYGTLSVGFFKAFEYMPAADGGTADGSSKSIRVMLKSTTVQGLKREVLALESQLCGMQVGASTVHRG